MLGLGFDPPENKDAKIQHAAEEWKRRLSDIVANEADSAKRKNASDELALEKDMMTVMGDKKSRNIEARALKDARREQLGKLIDIMKMGQTGTLEVTSAQIHNIQRRTGLAEKTITDVYTEKGFAVQKKPSTAVLSTSFLDTVVMNKIRTHLEGVHHSKLPQFPWVGKVRDLYDLTCYLNGGAESDAAGYRQKRAEELHSILQVYAIKLAADPSEEMNAMTDLIADATANVFNTEANRKKYDQSLKREQLGEFFALLKSAPEDFKRERFFAESCIRTIQKSFPDFNLALALYNQEAGIVKEPYEPIEALIHVTCAYCHTALEFHTHEEAENAKCPVCGAPLYIRCPKCGKKAPASADRCSCGFQISEMQFFDEYLHRAEKALLEMDLTEAERQLANAENAYPNNPRLGALCSKIQQEVARYKKPLEELAKLIAASKYSQAQARLEAAVAAEPKLKLDSQRKVIQQKLKLAADKMPPAGASPVERANACVDVLQIVADYQPAIDVLAMIRPRAPLNFRCVVNATGGLVCALSWNSAGDRGVSYTVLRKVNGIPKNHTDGQVLASHISKLEYKDSTLEPGISYGYAVVACRQGAYSDPATFEVTNFQELDPQKLHTGVGNGTCQFSWTLPKNCIGVRILRSTSGSPPESPNESCTVVAPRAAATFTDSGVKNNTVYSYRLQCIYPYANAFRYSRGVTCSLTPTEPPVPMNNLVCRVEGTRVSLKWNAPDQVRRTILVREAGGTKAANYVGQVLPMSDINSLLNGGRNYGNTTSDMGGIQFDIPVNTACQPAVISVSSAQGIICGVLNASSVERCEIDKQKTKVENNQLRLYLAHLPQYLDMIYYSVNRKAGDKAAWSTVEHAKRGVMEMVPPKEYLKNGMIFVQMLPKDDLYITVIGRYRMPDGSFLYSEPSKMRISNLPKPELRYGLKWATGFFGGPKRQNCRLWIRTNAEETPEIKLVYRTDGHIPMTMSDPKIRVLHVIPESDDGFPGGEYNVTLPDSLWQGMPRGTSLRLMLSDADQVGYQVVPDNPDKLKVPDA